MASTHSISKKRFVNIFHNPVSAWLILGISLALTAGAYFVSDSFVKQRAEDRFNFRTQEIELAIKDRLHIYEQTLWGGVAYMYASERVTRQQWAKYVETLDVNKHWPGIQGIGFSISVKPEDKQTHINQIRDEGYPEYTIKPEGQRDFYTSIIYIEPFDWRNKRAFGYDMWSNKMRRVAMARARDEGVATTSGIITLVQETDDDVQRGFLIYLPVYKTETTPTTVQERREQFVGWIYAPFRTGDLMNGILSSKDPNVEFEIFDGMTLMKDTLLFDSNNQIHIADTRHKPYFSRAIYLTLYGQPWTIYFSTPNDYVVGGANQPRYVAMAGLVVDLFLFYVIYALYFINRRAEAMAKEMTKELGQAKSGLEVQVKERTAELQKARDGLEVKVKERTEALQEKTQVLEEKARALELTSQYKSEFLASMSHELRTPLNSMLILSQMLSENKMGNLTEKQVEDLKVVHRSGMNLLTLIDEILDLAKIEAGHVEVYVEDVDLVELSTHCEQNFRPFAKQKGLSFSVGLAAGLPTHIRTDRQKTEQIVKNLLSNAFKFTEQGSVTLHIHRPDLDINRLPTGFNPKETIAISVSDTGIGVPEDKQEIIFEAFQQADGTTSRKYGGTGLGLSISRKLAKVLGGEIQLDGEGGEGSTFTLYLPEILKEIPQGHVQTSRGVETEVTAETASDADSHIHETAEKASLLKNKKILVVDDDISNIYALIPVLEKQGMKVLVAGDGEEGLRCLNQNPDIDVMLMDIMKQDMDGYQVINTIRQQERFETLPILAVTAQSTRGDRDRCIDAGATDSIPKPIDTDKLVSLMKVWL